MYSVHLQRFAVGIRVHTCVIMGEYRKSVNIMVPIAVTWLLSINRFGLYVGIECSSDNFFSPAQPVSY